MDEGLKKPEPLGNGVEIFTSRHHAFGTDAVLLANFAMAKKSDRVVDLGTGCGIIPFLILRDTGLESAVGVDISAEATDLCVASAKHNGFDNFTAINSDLNDLKGKIPFGEATLVTCNPPYKAPGAGLKNPDSVVMAARHEIFCTLEDIISVSAKLLKTAGRLCICHRPERLAELLCVMRQYKIEPKRLRLVCKQSGSKPWLVLVEGRRCANSGIDILSPLYVYENGSYSKEMLEIYSYYKEAYL